MTKTTTLFELDLHLGEPTLSGALHMYPLVSSPVAMATTARDYVPGPEAGAHLEVHELDGGGSVPELDVLNTAFVPLLLVEGEMLVGGLQNRTLNVSVLIPSGATTRIPVSCVEAGRWDRQSQASRSARHAPARLRANKTQSVNRSMHQSAARLSDQAGVWADVADYSRANQVHSASAALEDVHTSTAPTVDAMVRPIRPVADQLGVVVAVGGKPVALELFDDPATLDTYWDSLMRGFALDALNADPESPARPDRALRFLRRVSKAQASETGGVGLGDELHLTSDRVTGTGLRWKGRVRHLAAFALAA